MECEKVLEKSSEMRRRETVGQLGKAKKDGLGNKRDGDGDADRQIETDGSLVE